MRAYINRQGGVHTVEAVGGWATEHLLSLRALHVSGLDNRGPNLMSSSNLLDKWWFGQFGTAAVDLFASYHNTYCPLLFTLASQDNSPLGVDVFALASWRRKFATPSHHFA